MLSKMLLVILHEDLYRNQVPASLHRPPIDYKSRSEFLALLGNQTVSF